MNGSRGWGSSRLPLGLVKPHNVLSGLRPLVFRMSVGHFRPLSFTVTEVLKLEASLCHGVSGLASLGFYGSQSSGKEAHPVATGIAFLALRIVPLSSCSSTPQMLNFLSFAGSFLAKFLIGLPCSSLDAWSFACVSVWVLQRTA